VLIGVNNNGEITGVPLRYNEEDLSKDGFILAFLNTILAKISPKSISQTRCWAIELNEKRVVIVVKLDNGKVP